MFQILEFLRYILASGNAHAIQAPFMFEWYGQLQKAKDDLILYQPVEAIRNKALHTTDVIEVTDFGAGSKRLKATSRSIRDIARYSAKPPRLCRLLACIASQSGKGSIVELGTSLGFTTMYLSTKCPDRNVYTFEGCTSIAARASDNFAKAGMQNITLTTGNFRDTLPLFLADTPTPGFVFIDGNHTYEATVQYFKEFLPFVGNDTVIVLDDIHWSEGMKRAWEEIKRMPEVKSSVDFFYFGVIFFRRELSVRHLVLRY